MPKKSKSSAKKKAAPKSAKRSPVRNSAVPKPSTRPAKKSVEITYDLIAQRAYFIHISGTGGSESDNWHRAERELRSGT